mmetsp:Transcript_20641/g.39212  ORF Transcript_20641/g.39212 Transcript_20641/m.39212 type:complete len:308 (+) Transcript_20641:106-1029(+)
MPNNNYLLLSEFDIVKILGLVSLGGLPLLRVDFFQGGKFMGQRNLVNTLFLVRISRGNKFAEFLDVFQDFGTTIGEVFGPFIGHGKTVVGGKCASTEVANLGMMTDRISLTHLGALFGSSNIHFVLLEPSRLLVDGSNHPSTIADSSGLQSETHTEENVSDRGGKECERESRRDQLPCDRRNNSRNECSHKTRIKECLDTVRYSQHVRFTVFNVHRSRTSSDEKAGNDAKLSTDHETRETTSPVSKQKIARALGPNRCVALFFCDLGDRKESNLHAFQHTNDTPQNNGDDHGDQTRNSIPHGSLTIE